MSDGGFRHSSKKLSKKSNSSPNVSFQSYRERQKFGSYCIIFEHFNEEEYKKFSAPETFESTIQKLLPNLPMTKIQILCERHPEILHIFLDFFLHVNTRKHQPKSYIPFISHIVPRLPIRWISIFIRNCEDPRWAYLVMNSVFSTSTQVVPHMLEQIQENISTWNNYLQAFPNYKSVRDTKISAWQHLIEYRTAALELISYKIQYKFYEYLTINKKDFVENMVMKSASPVQLMRTLKTQIVPYSQTNNINYEKIISENVCKKPWDVEQKLKICQEFINNPNYKQKMLEEMTFLDEDELEKIREFAKQNSIQYEPNPSVYEECISMQHAERRPSSRRLTGRSNSIDCLNIQAIRSKLSKTPEKKHSCLQPSAPVSEGSTLKKSPSIDLSMNSMPNLGVYSSLADGNCSSSDVYAERLAKYRNLKEIRPIYDLAKDFDIVVSYDEFNDPYGRQTIFDKLISRDGWDKLSVIVYVLKLDPNDLMFSIANNQNYIDQGVIILPKLYNYITRWNSSVFYTFLNDCIAAALNYTPMDEILPLWYESLQNTFRKIEGKDVDLLLALSRVISVLIDLSKDVKDRSIEPLQKQILDTFQSNDNLTSLQKLEKVKQILLENQKEKEANDLIPVVNDYTKEQFINDFTNENIQKVSNSVIQIRLMKNKEESIDFVQTLIDEVDGKQYSILFLAYQLLLELTSSNFNMQNLVQEITLQRTDSKPDNQEKEEKQEITLRIDHSEDALQHNFDIIKDMTIITELHSGAKHNIDFHELISDSMTTLKNNTTTDTIWGLLPVCKFFDIPQDTLLLHVMINKMISPYFDDYKDYIDKLEIKTHAELLTVLAPRLNRDDLTFLYNSLGMVEEKKKMQTVTDLNNNGLSEFAINDLLDNPEKLIHELYCKTQLHDTLGKRLNRICDTIAYRYDLKPGDIRKELVKEWLNKEYPPYNEEEENKKVSCFEQTYDDILTENDCQAVQTTLFILRSWGSKDSLLFLKQIAETTECSRCRCRAIASMFGLADEELVYQVCGDTQVLDDICTRALFCSHAQAHGLTATEDDFTPQNIDNTLKDHDEPWADMIRFNVKFNNDDEIAKLIIKLAEKVPIFILKIVPKICTKLPLMVDLDVLDALVHAVSKPFESLINKDTATKQLNTRQNEGILRLVFAAISLMPTFSYFYIKNEKLPISEVINQLSKIGCSSVAADLSARISNLETRGLALDSIVRAGHYDMALQVGFHDEHVFNLILESGLEEATETMFDENLIRMTAYLHMTNNQQALDRVAAALTKQGRSREVLRMKQRLENLDKKIADEKSPEGKRVVIQNP